MGLRLKKAGNQIVSLLGGREIHPVSAAVGGFHRVPSRAELEPLREELKWALDASIATAKLVSTFEYITFEPDYEFVALRHPTEYPLNEGRIVSNRGLDISADEYEDHFQERHVKHSNALHSYHRGFGSYLVGPLSRFNLNFDKLPEIAQQVARDCRLTPPVRNPFRSIGVRAVELVFACHEALRILDAYEPPPEPRVKVRPRSAIGRAATEAPRGILYHRYELDEHGLIVTAKIVPPTSQNQPRIEDDLRELMPGLVAESDAEITLRAEQAVRNYDPCISCATHFLKLNLDRT